MFKLNKAPVIDGYDLEAEKGRYEFDDVTVNGRTLNRAKTKISITGDMVSPSHSRVVEAHSSALFTNTLAPDSPVIELGYPTAGPYVMCKAGVYMDLELGCAQKLLDEHHPKFRKAVSAIVENGLALRREINTDDYLFLDENIEGVYITQDLASMMNKAVQDRFPRKDGYKTFLSNSGSEATEAGLKLASLVRYRKFQEKYGDEVFVRVCEDLGIDEIKYMTDNSTDEKIYRTYPMFMIACKGAFHGRTLGSLMGTVSRKIHHIGFPKGAFYRHITYNGDPAELAEMLDTRPITEILDSPGGVKAVVDSGKVPVDLVGVFLAEPFQGEGGYKPGDPAFFQGVTEILKKYDIPYMSDEVQSFARTGKLFATEHLGVTPDILSTAKGAFVGITVGPAEWERYLHDGWHSNTWGGGKVFDTHIAATTIDTLENYRDPVFDGLSYMENETVKGKYLEMLLDDLHSRHPDVFFGAEGVGLMQSLKVADRAKFLSTAWKYGLKFLSAGLLDENGNGKVRLLMLADTLATEVEDLVVNLDNVFTAMEG